MFIVHCKLLLLDHKLQVYSTLYSLQQIVATHKISLQYTV